MKTVLVDEGAGHEFLQEILYGNIIFSILSPDSTVTYLFSWFYKILKIDTYVEFEIVISIIWNMILLLMILKNKKKVYSFTETIFLMLSIMVLNIFDFCLSKEPIQMLYFIFIYLILKSNRIGEKKQYILSLLVILLSVFTFRTYYILIILFTITIQILCKMFIIKKETVKIVDIAKIIFLIGLVYFIFLNIAKIFSPENFNELIRVRLRTSSAASDMGSLFHSINLVIFCIDYLIMLIRMAIPIELLPLGIKYIPYVIYQLFITYYFIKALRNIKKNQPEQNIALYIFIGFFLASATFEPDFGSWVRHESVVLPIIFIFNGMIIKNKKELT